MAKKKITVTPKVAVTPITVTPKTKVLVVVPACHTDHLQYKTEVLAAINTNLKLPNIQATFHPYPAADSNVTDAVGWQPVVDQFNAVTEQFLAGDYEYLWLVEADVVVPPNALEHLLSDNVDCASAVIPYHFQNYRPEIQFKDLVICGFFAAQPSFENYNLKLPQIKDKTLVGSKEHPIFAGTGCILLKRGVFEGGLRWRWDAKVCGFDVYFWLDIQRLGFSAVVDGFVVCRHLGV